MVEIYFIHLENGNNIVYILFPVSYKRVNAHKMPVVAFQNSSIIKRNQMECERGTILIHTGTNLLIRVHIMCV